MVIVRKLPVMNRKKLLVSERNYFKCCITASKQHAGSV